MAATVGKQTNVVANKARKLIFFEEDGLCYNYGTQQWTEPSVYDDYGLFSVNNPVYDIGIVRFSNGSVDLQVQTTSDIAQDITITTSAGNLNPYGRAVVNSVRPLYSGISGGGGGVINVSVGVQNNVAEVPTYGASDAPESRTGKAFFRREARYHRFRVTTSELDFDTMMGLEIEFIPQGKV